MGSQLLLRWDNHLPSFACSMKECLDDGDLTDLTISCQGRVLHCHKLVLSVASPHFKQLLKANPGHHPIVIMRDIPYKDMAALLTFIYQGEVTVSEEELPSLLKTAKALEVRGLADDDRSKTGGGPAAPGVAARPAAGRPSHLEPEVVVKEEPCDPDETPAGRPPGAMATISDMSLLNSPGAAPDGDRFGEGTSFEMTQAGPPTKTVSPCVVRLEKLDGGGGGGGGAMSHVVSEPPASGDPAAANLDDMLIPGTSALLDRILRRQLSLPERGYFCPYCTREVNMRTLGKHMTKIHGGMRLQCKACREVVHTRVTSLLINHGICVLLLNKNSKLGDQLIRKLSRQIRSIYKNRRFKSQMLKRYPDLSYFCSSFIFGRVKQPCARCGLVLWSSSMASHLEKCGEDVIQCDFCNKHMARTRLPYHVDIYHPGKVIQHKPLPLPPPPLADDSGSESPRPLAHPVFSAAADDEMPSSAQIVTCTKCNKKMRQNNLRRHMRVMHPWKPSMRRVDPATGLTRRPAAPSSPPQLQQQPLTLSDDEPMDGDEEPVELPAADNKYAAYKRSCPVCDKIMWKKYLVSHVRSSHPQYELDEEAERQLNARPPPPGAVSKAKVIKHCPYCWKTMWRCNVKRHIRQVHPEHSHELTESFDLEAAIRAAALERGLPPPASDLSSAGEEETITQDAATLAIQEMNAMAEAEGMEALEAEDEQLDGDDLDDLDNLDVALEDSETVPTNSRKHEKNLKRCRYCRKLLRGCHMRRHILNWHSGSPGKPSNKTGVPGGLNPARQRTCPVCLKVVVVNNLRRHIRASHPEVSEDELHNITDMSYPGMSAVFVDDASNDASLPDGDETSSSRSGPSAPAPAPAAATPEGTTPGGSYASRRMRRCPYCGKVMVSSNMARHCKTHHPAEWRATHGAGSGAARADARSAAEAAEEMEAMNAEETAAWLDEAGELDATDELLDEADAFEDEDDEDPIGVGTEDLEEEDEPAEHPDVLAAGEVETAEDPLGLADSPADHPDLLEEADEPADHPDLLEEAEEPADHPDLLEEAEEPADHPDLLEEAEEPADHPDLMAEAEEAVDHPDAVQGVDDPLDAVQINGEEGETAPA